jgi:hypothetical protein
METEPADKKPIYFIFVRSTLIPFRKYFSSSLPACRLGHYLNYINKDVEALEDKTLRGSLPGKPNDPDFNLSTSQNLNYEIHPLVPIAVADTKPERSIRRTYFCQWPGCQ